jgi:hypothetical protein
VLPQKAEEFRQMLHNWPKSVGAQMPTPNPGCDPAREKERKLDPAARDVDD